MRAGSLKPLCKKTFYLTSSSLSYLSSSSYFLYFFLSSPSILPFTHRASQDLRKRIVFQPSSSARVIRGLWTSVGSSQLVLVELAGPCSIDNPSGPLAVSRSFSSQYPSNSTAQMTVCAVSQHLICMHLPPRCAKAHGNLLEWFQFNAKWAVVDLLLILIVWRHPLQPPCVDQIYCVFVFSSLVLFLASTISIY